MKNIIITALFGILSIVSILKFTYNLNKLSKEHIVQDERNITLRKACIYGALTGICGLVVIITALSYPGVAYLH